MMRPSVHFDHLARQLWQERTEMIAKTTNNEPDTSREETMASVLKTFLQ